MRKVLFAFVLVIMLFYAIPVFAGEIIVEIDGRPVIFPDQPPIMQNERVLIPIRGVLEDLGYEVGWDPVRRAVIINTGNSNDAGPGPNINWVVPPTLEHTEIRLCNCGMFLNPQGVLIDPITGHLTDDFHFGHGGPPPGYVYDPVRSLFGQPGFGGAYHDLIGMYSLNGFVDIFMEIFGEDHILFQWVIQATNGLIAVESVDSSMRVEGEGLFEDEWWLTQEAFSGRFALMYGREFVTDFIFDEISQLHRRFHLDTEFELIAVRMGNLWGLADKNGNIVMPFMFENFILIDRHTAFARLPQGQYGIISIRTFA